MAITKFQNNLVNYGIFVIFYAALLLQTAGQQNKNSDLERLFSDKSRSHRINRDDRRFHRRLQEERERLSEMPARSERPNIILVITDDQDEVLGENKQIFLNKISPKNEMCL